MGRYQAIVLDFDGTIADGLESWLEMYKLFEEKYGITLTKEEKHRIYVGSVRSIATAYLSLFDHLHNYFTVDSLTQYFVDNTREGTLNSPPIKGSIEFIKEMHQKQIPIAIASSSTVPTISAFLEKHGVFDCVKTIVVGTDVQNCKPAPDIFIRAAGLLGHSIEETVIFEDSILALANAKKVGFKAVLINQPVAPPESYDIHIMDFTSPLIRELF